MTTFLTDDEIASITHPLTQGAARCRFFERRGVKLWGRKLDGQPLVLRSDLENAKAARSRQERAPAPDWDKLRAMGGRRLRSVVT